MGGPQECTTIDQKSKNDKCGKLDKLTEFKILNEKSWQVMLLGKDRDHSFHSLTESLRRRRSGRGGGGGCALELKTGAAASFYSAELVSSPPPIWPAKLTSSATGIIPSRAIIHSCFSISPKSIQRTNLALQFATVGLFSYIRFSPLFYSLLLQLSHILQSLLSCPSFRFIENLQHSSLLSTCSVFFCSGVKLPLYAGIIPNSWRSCFG